MFDACPNSAIPGLANHPLSIKGATCIPVETASQAGIPQGLCAISKRLPRFGFAYKLTDDDKTVLRGGIGAYPSYLPLCIFVLQVENLSA